MTARALSEVGRFDDAVAHIESARRALVEAGKDGGDASKALADGLARIHRVKSRAAATPAPPDAPPAAEDR